MSDRTTQLVEAVLAADARKDEQIAELRKENARLIMNTFQPHRTCADNSWDDGNDGYFETTEEDDVYESSLATLRASLEELARCAQRSAEADLKVEEMKVKVEQDKLAKGKTLVDKVKGKLRGLAHDIELEEDKLVKIKGQVDDARVELHHYQLQLNNARIELGGITTQIETMRLDLHQVNNRADNMQNAPSGIIDNSRVDHSQSTTIHHHYQAGSAAVLTAPPVPSSTHMTEAHTQLAHLNDTRQDQHKSSRLVLLQRTQRHQAPQFRTKCRFGNACTNLTCRFLHDDQLQRKHLKHLFRTLPHYKKD